MKRQLLKFKMKSIMENGGWEGGRNKLLFLV